MNRFLTLSLLAATCLSAQTKFAPVPAAYQDIYSNLSSQINSFRAAVRSSSNGGYSSSSVLASPQLVGADSSQFSHLIVPGYYSNYVLPQLQELDALGAKSVTVHVDFPVLYQPFYASNPSQYQQFVDFYQQLALDVRAHGMKLVVESGLSSVFPGNDAASYSSYVKSLSWNAYMAGRAQNAATVAQLMQPDFMTVIMEPDTEQSNSGQANAGTVAGSTQLLKTILAAVKSSGSNVPVGAGAGTWIPSFLQYIQSFAATSVSFVDMHIYPINKTFFTNAIAAANLIHAAGKQASVSEAWVYKIRDNELGKMSYTDIYGRDPYSFWAPIDIAFLNAVVEFGNAKQLAFVAPFWSHYLSSYVDYNATCNMSTADRMNASYTAYRNAVVVGAFTPTGISFLNSIIPAPDSSAPYVPAAPSLAGVTANTAYLTWTTDSDNVGVAAYKLYRNGTLIATTSLTSFADSGLAPGTNYTYTVSAFDASGNVSPQSAQLKVKTAVPTVHR